MNKLAPKERVPGFIRYCREVVSAFEKKEITMGEAGQLLFLGNLYDKDLTAYFKSSPDVFITDEILDIAGDLEELAYYPDYYNKVVHKDPDRDWARVVKLVNAFQ